MSKGKEIAVQVAGVSSSQEWTTDPDMVEVIVTDDLLLRAEKCIPFMLENDISYMYRWWSFGYTLYELAENMDDDDLKGKTIIQGTDGQSYVEFEPEYRLDGCHAKIFKDGTIRAVLPFKNTSDELWFNVGAIADLKQRMGLGNELAPSSGGAALHATQQALSQAMQHSEKAGKFVGQVAGLSIWGHDQDDGTPYEECKEPDEGYLDSHRCLMDLVEQARGILREYDKEGELFAEGSAEWFRAKYDGQEHPEWPRSDWQYQVSNEDTALGYWEWVASNVESNETDSDAD